MVGAAEREVMYFIEVDEAMEYRETNVGKSSLNQGLWKQIDILIRKCNKIAKSFIFFWKDWRIFSPTRDSMRCKKTIPGIKEICRNPPVLLQGPRAPISAIGSMLQRLRSILGGETSPTRSEPEHPHTV
jgi:hypothetical protein